jgi:hypothetical protein
MQGNAWALGARGVWSVSSVSFNYCGRGVFHLWPVQIPQLAPSAPPLDPLWPQDPWQGAGNTLFPAPTSSDDHAEWLEGLRAWQTATRAAAGIPAEGGEVHQVPELRWTQTSYIQPQVHTFDRMLWNETGAHYTVDRYLDDCERRYGGIDSVLLWPTYPNLGLDERNQYDLIRLAELRGAIETFHARGVHVLLPYNPWDTATRRESTPDETTLAELSVQLQTDGVNGDTIQRVSRSFYAAGLAAGRALAIEPEGGGYPDTNTSADAAQWSATNWSPLGWGYCWLGTAKSDNETTVYLAAPGVDRAYFSPGDRRGARRRNAAGAFPRTWRYAFRLDGRVVRRQ